MANLQPSSIIFNFNGDSLLEIPSNNDQHEHFLFCEPHSNNEYLTSYISPSNNGQVYQFRFPSFLTLNSFSFSRTRNREPVSSDQRFRVKLKWVNDIIHTIEYLHNGLNSYHGNLSTRSFVLDENLDIKLAFLGKRIHEFRIDDNIYYYAPEYIQKLQNGNNLNEINDAFEKKLDLYSLGIILNEIITEVPPSNSFANLSLTTIRQSLAKPNNSYLEKIDPNVNPFWYDFTEMIIEPLLSPMESRPDIGVILEKFNAFLSQNDISITKNRNPPQFDLLSASLVQKTDDDVIFQMPYEIVQMITYHDIKNSFLSDMNILFSDEIIVKNPYTLIDGYDFALSFESDTFHQIVLPTSEDMIYDEIESEIQKDFFYPIIPITTLNNLFTFYSPLVSRVNYWLIYLCKYLLKLQNAHETLLPKGFSSHTILVSFFQFDNQLEYRATIFPYETKETEYSKLYLPDQELNPDSIATYSFVVLMFELLSHTSHYEPKINIDQYAGIQTLYSKFKKIDHHFKLNLPQSDLVDFINSCIENPGNLPKSFEDVLNVLLNSPSVGKFEKTLCDFSMNNISTDISKFASITDNLNYHQHLSSIFNCLDPNFVNEIQEELAESSISSPYFLSLRKNPMHALFHRLFGQFDNFNPLFKDFSPFSFLRYCKQLKLEQELSNSSLQGNELYEENGEIFEFLLEYKDLVEEQQMHRRQDLLEQYFIILQKPIRVPFDSLPNFVAIDSLNKIVRFWSHSIPHLLQITIDNSAVVDDEFLLTMEDLIEFAESYNPMNYIDFDSQELLTPMQVDQIKQRRAFHKSISTTLFIYFPNIFEDVWIQPEVVFQNLPNIDENSKEDFNEK